MFARSVTLAALSALTLVAAQQSGTSGNPTAFHITVSEVDLATRGGWCSGQTGACTTLCTAGGQNAPTNDCDPNTLNFNCLCSNGSAPGLQYYVSTLPTFICNQAFSDCNTANVGNKTGQDNCITTIQKQCGTLDPSKAGASGGGSSSSSAASSSATGSATVASSATSASATATSTSSHNAAAMATPYMQHMGNGAVAVAVGLAAYML